MWREAELADLLMSNLLVNQKPNSKLRRYYNQTGSFIKFLLR